MDEHKTRSEELFEKAKEEKPSSDQGGGLAGKITQLFVGMRGALNKSQATEGIPKADAAKGDFKVPAIFSAQKLDLRSINQALAVILAGLIVLTAYVVLQQKQDVSTVAAAVSKIKFEDLKEGVITPFESLKFYLEQIKTRDIFNKYVEYVPPPPPVKVEPLPPPPPPPKVTIEEKAKNLKLMGVSWGSNPKAMIKDESTQKVHFLKKGQTIEDTQIKVKTILKNEVIISSDGDEMKML